MINIDWSTSVVCWSDTPPVLFEQPLLIIDSPTSIVYWLDTQLFGQPQYHLPLISSSLVGYTRNGSHRLCVGRMHNYRSAIVDYRLPHISCWSVVVFVMSHFLSVNCLVSHSWVSIAPHRLFIGRIHHCLNNYRRLHHINWMDTPLSDKPSLIIDCPTSVVHWSDTTLSDQSQLIIDCTTCWLSLVRYTIVWSAKVDYQLPCIVCSLVIYMYTTVWSAIVYYRMSHFGC